MTQKPSLFHALVSAGIRTGHQGGGYQVADIIVENTPQALAIINDYDVPKEVDSSVIEVPFAYNRQGAEEVFMERLQSSEYGIGSHRPHGDYNIINEIQKKMGCPINGQAFDSLAEAAISNEPGLVGIQDTGALRDLLATALALSHLEKDAYKAAFLLNGIKNDKRLPQETRDISDKAIGPHQILCLSLDLGTVERAIKINEPPQKKRLSPVSSLFPGTKISTPDKALSP